MGALAGWAVTLAVPCKVHAQEGNTWTLARVYDTEQTWRRAAVVVPGPGWGPTVRQAVPEPPRGRQTAVQKIVDDADKCVVAWRSKRRGLVREKIECWRKP